MRSWKYLAIGLGALAMTAASRPLHGSEPGTATAVALVMLADGGAGSQLERQLFTELGLTLDTLRVVTITVDATRFVDLPLERQIDAVEPKARQLSAVAAVWLVPGRPETVNLFLATVDRRFGLVRSVALTRGPRAVARLALAVRELLGAAYLLEPGPITEPAVGPVIESLRAQLAPKKDGKWKARADLVLDDRLKGGRNWSPGGGVAFGVEVITLQALHAQAGFELSTRRASGDGKHLETKALKPLAGVSYLWNMKWLQLGPTLRMQYVMEDARVEVDTAQSTFLHQRVHLAAGGDLRLLLNQEFAVVVTGLVGAGWPRDVYRRRSNDQVIFGNPKVDWSVTLGGLLPLATR